MPSKLTPVQFLDVQTYSKPGWLYEDPRRKPSRVWRRLQEALTHGECPYCRNTLYKHEEQNLRTYQNDDPDYPASDGLFQAILRCRCGWWSYHFRDGSEGQLGQEFQEGILRTLPVSSHEIPLTELTRHLGKDFSAIRHIDPHKLEGIIGGLFAEHLDCKVELTGRSHDGGVDLFTVEAEDPIAIQVKRRSRNASESVAAVRDFLGALVVNHVRRGIFVTTAPRFSTFAEEAKAQAELEGFLIDLIDFDRLRKIFDLSWKPGISHQGEASWKDLSYLSQRSDGLLESAETAPERHGLLPVDWWTEEGEL
jgi:hypothetical protein